MFYPFFYMECFCWEEAVHVFSNSVAEGIALIPVNNEYFAMVVGEPPCQSSACDCTHLW